MTEAKRTYDPVKYKTPTGTNLTCKGWIQEAALRMLLNNLDPEVAERPDDLIVYGGRGKAARNFEALDNIIAALKVLENDESLLIQCGKPVGILKTHKDAPRVLISNSQLVPNWANWEHFDELEKKGLMMYGQMTAGSWIYIGSQGIVQGTYETYAAVANKHFQREKSSHTTTRRIATIFITSLRWNIKRNIECNCRSRWHGWRTTTGHHHERRSGADC